MTPTWLIALLAIGALAAFVYFTCDLVVLLRGPVSVAPWILRLARAGDRRIAGGSLPSIAVTAAAAAFFLVIPAMWLLFRRHEVDGVGQLLLAGSTIAAVAWVGTLLLLIRRGTVRHRPPK